MDNLNVTVTRLFRTCIVGRRFHTGRVTGGDQVLFEREPNNAIDPNAILAKTMTEPHTVIGYIPAKVAVFMASWIDKNRFTIVSARVVPTFEIDTVPDNVPIPVEIVLTPVVTNQKRPATKTYSPVSFKRKQKQ